MTKAKFPIPTDRTFVIAHSTFGIPWSLVILSSPQRELNPHIRHGKAAGSRYIMGAFE